MCTLSEHAGAPLLATADAAASGDATSSAATSRIDAIPRELQMRSTTWRPLSAAGKHSQGEHAVVLIDLDRDTQLRWLAAKAGSCLRGPSAGPLIAPPFSMSLAT